MSYLIGKYLLSLFLKYFVFIARVWYYEETTQASPHQHPRSDSEIQCGTTAVTSLCSTGSILVLSGKVDRWKMLLQVQVLVLYKFSKARVNGRLHLSPVESCLCPRGIQDTTVKEATLQNSFLCRMIGVQKQAIKELSARGTTFSGPRS